MNQSTIELLLPVFIEKVTSKIESDTSRPVGNTLYHFGDAVKALSLALAGGPENSEVISKRAVGVAASTFSLWKEHNEKANP